MTRRQPIAVVASSLAIGLLGLSAVAAAPAHAEDEAPPPAGSVATVGEEVEPSTDLGAPTPVTAGAWRGEIGEGDGADATRYFVYERTMPESTVLVSAVSPGGDPGAEDGIELTAVDPAGEACTFSPATSSRLDDDPVLLSVSLAIGVQTAILEDDEDPFKCLEDDTVVIALSRAEQGAGTAPYSLRVVEEATLTSADGLPGPLEEAVSEPQAPATDSDPEELVGGRSFADAPEVADGGYRGASGSDTTLLYRVPEVGWGQRVRAEVFVQPVASVDENSTSGPEVQLAVLSPMWDDLAATETSVDGTDTSRAVVESAPVRYLNRRSDSFDPVPYLPGDHYLRLSVEPADGDEIEVDYTLQVAVTGDVDDAPAFDVDDAYLVADGDQQPLVTAVGAGGLLATVTTALRYAGAALLALVGLVALVAGVRILRTPATS